MPFFLKSPKILVTAILCLIGLGLIVFSWEANEPWEDRDLQRMLGRRLDVSYKDVPREVYTDPVKLGELNLGVDFYKPWGLYWAGWLVGGTLLIAGATCPLWWRLTERPKSDTEPTEPATAVAAARFSAPAPVFRWEIATLASLLLLAAFLRVPYLDRALYFDEQDNLRRNYHGHFETTAGSEAEPEWKPAGWNAAFFENRLGNNPIFYSVLAQTSHSIWRATTGADRTRYSVVAMRVPAIICGLLSLLAMWWVLRLWGFRWAALVAVAWGAMHAMHIDYSIQARGYAVVMLCVPLILGFGTLALRDGRWRWWLGLSIATLICLYSYAASIYAAVLINATILLVSIARKQGFGIARHLATSGLVAAIYGWLLSPHLPQLKYHFRQVFEMIPLRGEWIANAWSHYASGTNFPTGPEVGAVRSGDMTLEHAMFERFLPGEPFLAAVNWLIIPLLLILGLIAVWRREKLPAWLITAAIAAPFLALAHQRLTVLYLYYWYLIYGLPAMLILMSIAIESLRGSSKKRHIVWTAAVSIFLAAYFWQSSPWSPGDPEGRQPLATAWDTEPETGRKFVEFKRARHRWLAYEDGEMISIREFYDASGAPRAGRE